MDESTATVNPWIVAVAVMFATFMEVLDTTVVNVSLPHIAGNLSATIDESTWVLTSYLVANAVILPLTGWLATNLRAKAAADGVGHRLHALASLLCGLAPNLPSLVAFRLLQGATGGAMQPLSQAILLEAFPPAPCGARRWASGASASSSRPSLARCWAAGSPTATAGAGSSTSTCRWASSSLVMTRLFVFDPPLPAARVHRRGLLGHRPAGPLGGMCCSWRSTSGSSATGSRRRSSRRSSCWRLRRWSLSSSAS